ncbi:hypothetical protein Dsin_014490 [Dipteronia sinensis]|uniref:Uncharacterized protein n=1 Tax=Dipteronia sinensis TaxID=43782 RepID=A0AAE0AMM3_9ROSI|nr:hypothetical protein Dsin_014490 [Dipteronia sinensis]
MHLKRVISIEFYDYIYSIFIEVVLLHIHQLDCACLEIMVKSTRSSVTSVMETKLRKGAWSPEEDQKLIAYIHSRHSIWNWVVTPKAAGVLRTGKSCRLRWLNYLRPGIKHGNFSQEEDETIIKLHQQLGNRWSTVASRLPGRTDNEIKNHWHTHLKKYCLKNNNIFQETETETDDPSEDDDLLLFNLQKPSNVNASSSMSLSSSPSGDPTGEFDNNQTIEENDGSSQTYVELQRLWDPVPASFPMEGLYGTTTYTLASYYDAGDDVSAFLLMQQNEESI